MKILGIVNKKISELKISNDNVRKIELTRDSLKSLLDSILAYGRVINPIMIDEDNNVVQGRRRFEASKLANIDDIDCILVNFDGDKFNGDSEAEKKVVSWTENKVRAPITDDEETATLNQLRSKGFSLDFIAPLLGEHVSGLSYISGRSREPPAFKIDESMPKTEGQEQPKLDQESQEKAQAAIKFKTLENKQPRKYSVVRRLLNKKPYSQNVKESVKLVNFAEVAPLSMIENVEKEVKSGVIPNLEARMVMADKTAPYSMQLIKIKNEIKKEIDYTCKIRGYDFYQFIEESIVKNLERRTS